jgi:hypothetical protein
LEAQGWRLILLLLLLLLKRWVAVLALAALPQGCIRALS